MRSMFLFVAVFVFAVVGDLCSQESDYEKELKAEQVAAEKVIAQAARPERLKMLPLPVAKFGDNIVVEPVAPYNPKAGPIFKFSTDKTEWEFPLDPGQPLNLQDFKGKDIYGKKASRVNQLVALPDGAIALATNNGGYVISKDGKIQVIGEGSECGSVALSPTGEIAFGLTIKKAVKTIKFRDGGKFEVSQTIWESPEVHILGSKPRLVVFRQFSSPHPFGFHDLAFSNDTMVMLTYPLGLTILAGDKAWRDPKTDFSTKLHVNLVFDPATAKRFIYHAHVYELDLGKGGAFTRSYIGARGNSSSLYGSKGEIVSIKRNWRDRVYVYDGSSETYMEVQYQVGCMAVSEKFLAYTSQSAIMLWDRSKHKTIRKFWSLPEDKKDLPGIDYGPLYVWAMAFTPAQQLVVATDNGEVSEWNPETGKKNRVIVPAR